jgi:hypothetical protein
MPNATPKISAKGARTARTISVTIVTLNASDRCFGGAGGRYVG